MYYRNGWRLNRSADALWWYIFSTCVQVHILKKTPILKHFETEAWWTLGGEKQCCTSRGDRQKRHLTALAGWAGAQDTSWNKARCDQVLGNTFDHAGGKTLEQSPGDAAGSSSLRIFELDWRGPEQPGRIFVPDLTSRLAVFGELEGLSSRDIYAYCVCIICALYRCI